MGTKTLLTVREYESLTDDGFKHELDEGELITMSAPKSLHSAVASNIYDELLLHVRQFRLKVLMEAGFLLADDPPVLRQPDVAVIYLESLRQTPEDEYFHFAPELAVEVSPSDSMPDFDRKIEQYLAAGSKLAWVVMPKHKRIRIFRADGTSAVRHAGELLDAPELLPSWSMPVDRVFA